MMESSQNKFLRALKPRGTYVAYTEEYKPNIGLVYKRSVKRKKQIIQDINPEYVLDYFMRLQDKLETDSNFSKVYEVKQKSDTRKD